MSENDQPLSNWLASLVHPNEQPSGDKTSRFDATVCSAIVFDCVRHRWFSAQTLYRKLELCELGVPGHLPVNDLCENRLGGLMLWSDGCAHYLPCRENAKKALVRLPVGPPVDRILDLLGLASVEELVAVVNQLPSGTKFDDGRCPAFA